MPIVAKLKPGYGNVRIRLCGRWTTYKKENEYVFNRSQYSDLVKYGLASQYFTFRKKEDPLPSLDDFEDDVKTKEDTPDNKVGPAEDDPVMPPEEDDESDKETDGEPMEITGPDVDEKNTKSGKVKKTNRRAS